MSGIESFGEKIRIAINKLLGAPIADRKTIEEVIKELQRALLLADVNVNIVLKVSEKIKERAFKEKCPPGVSRKDHILKILYEELINLLGEKPYPLQLDKNKKYVFMFVGIQGSGKTTTVAKIANYLKKQGYKIGVICADTYRPAAYEQLNQLLSPLGIPVFFNENSKNAIEIAKEGLEKFFSSGINIILIDTAGRHKEQEFLLKEMKELEKEIKPNEVILTLDGTIGQQASIQAEAFHKATPIGSIIVTKLDTSAKGGGALSAVAATGAKIRFIGVGEKIDDIEAFYPNRFVGRLLGMGDIEGLIERVKLAEMQVSEEKVQALLSGHFTLEDMISQIKETRKLGPLRKIISKFPLPMLPNISDEQLEIAEKEMDKWSAIINSMTPEERKNPEILNSSRIKRIARGAGVLEGDVKKLIKQYNLMKKLMKSWKKRKGVPKLKI